MGENLFEEEFTIEALSQMGNPLERLSSLVDFEMFRPVLEEVLLPKECKTPAGHKPIDVVLMFKVIFLQRYYGLGDHQIHQIRLFHNRMQLYAYNNIIDIWLQNYTFFYLLDELNL